MKTSTISRSAAGRRLLQVELSGAELRLTVGGVWELGDGIPDPGPVADALAQGGATGAAGAAELKRVVVLCEGLERADSALAAYLVTIYDLCESSGVAFDLAMVDAGLAKLIGLARAVPERTGTGRKGGRLTSFDHVGGMVLGGWHELDGQLLFFGEMCQSVARLFAGKARFRLRDVMEAVEDSGPRSLVIVTVISLLIGMILAFIGAVQLRRFGAGVYVADLVGLAMTREMAGVMTGIVIAGKTGAAFAARIGTMQAQEEIDALTTLGLSPFDYLVLPRVIGLSLMMPLLYLYACAVGLAGGMLVGTTVLDLSVLQYWHQTQNVLRISQFMIGLSKSLVFGVLVAMAGCMRGIQCGRSAAAVGDATTSAVVTSILYIIITDAVFAVALEVWGI